MRTRLKSLHSNRLSMKESVRKRQDQYAEHTWNQGLLRFAFGLFAHSILDTHLWRDRVESRTLWQKLIERTMSRTKTDTMFIRNVPPASCGSICFANVWCGRTTLPNVYNSLPRPHRLRWVAALAGRWRSALMCRRMDWYNAAGRTRCSRCRVSDLQTDSIIHRQSTYWTGALCIA